MGSLLSSCLLVGGWQIFRRLLQVTWVHLLHMSLDWKHIDTNKNTPSSCFAYSFFVPLRNSKILKVFDIFKFKVFEFVSCSISRTCYDFPPYYSLQRKRTFSSKIFKIIRLISSSSVNCLVALDLFPLSK